MNKPIRFSTDFEEALKKRFIRHFRYDNSLYWKDYYQKKLSEKDVEREQRYAKILLRRLGSKAKVIDAGCGIGFLTKEMKKAGLSVTAVDLFPDMIKEARGYLGKSKINLIKADMIKLPAEKNSFDGVVAMSVIEHFPVPEIRLDLLPEFKRVLKPKGYLFVHVPVRTIGSVLVRFFRKYIYHDLPKWAIDDDGDVTHKIWMTSKEYIKFMVEEGFRLEGIDYYLTRSNLKPVAWSRFAKKVERLLNGKSDPELLKYRLSITNKVAKKLKSTLALTSYMVFRKK